MSSGSQVQVIFESLVLDEHAQTVAVEDLRSKNADKLAEFAASLAANQSVTVDSAVMTPAGLHDAVIDSTTLTREAVKAFGLLGSVQTHPQAPPMNLLDMRPDIIGATIPLPQGTIRDQCAIDIPWSIVLGASILHASAVRVAFQLTDSLRDTYGVCIQSSPSVKGKPNTAILYRTQFITFGFTSLDNAFVVAETVNQQRKR